MKSVLLKTEGHLHQKTVEDVKVMVQQGLADLEAGRVKPADEVFARLEKKYQNML